MKKEKKAPMKMLTLREHYQLYPNMAEAAWDVGVEKNTYQLWLAGKSFPTFPSIKKLHAKNICILNFPD